MNFKCLSPKDFIKLSSAISLLLVEKFDEENLDVIKNLLFSIGNNISNYCNQNNFCKKLKKDKK